VKVKRVRSIPLVHALLIIVAVVASGGRAVAFEVTAIGGDLYNQMPGQSMSAYLETDAQFSRADWEVDGVRVWRECVPAAESVFTTALATSSAATTPYTITARAFEPGTASPDEDSYTAHAWTVDIFDDALVLDITVYDDGAPTTVTVWDSAARAFVVPASQVRVAEYGRRPQQPFETGPGGSPDPSYGYVPPKGGPRKDPQGRWLDRGKGRWKRHNDHPDIHWDVEPFPYRPGVYVVVRPPLEPTADDPNPQPTVEPKHEDARDKATDIQDAIEEHGLNLNWFSPGEIVTVLGGTVATVGVGYIVYRIVRGGAGVGITVFSGGAATGPGIWLVFGP